MHAVGNYDCKPPQFLNGIIAQNVQYIIMHDIEDNEWSVELMLYLHSAVDFHK